MVWDLLVSPSQGTIFVKTDDRWAAAIVVEEPCGG